MIDVIRSVAAFPLLAGFLAAQVPAHATVLNPTTIQGHPTFVQDGDTVHAFAMGPASIFHARSLDGGRTWPLREQAVGLPQTYSPSAPDDDTVELLSRPGELLVLCDNSSLGPMVARSLDDGTTWSAPIPIAAGTVTDVDRMSPSIHADGSNLVVAWTNRRATGRVFCNRSSDNGLTWQATDTRLDLGVPASPLTIWNVRVLGSGPILNVFWNTYHQRSIDGGATWLPQAATLPTASGSLGAFWEVAGDGNALLASDGNGTLLRSADTGATWSTVTNSGIPRVVDVAIAGTLVVAVGTNGTFPPTYHVNTSTDGGATWRPVPLLLPSPTTLNPRAIARPGELLVYWPVPGAPGGAIRTIDAGASWHRIEGPMQGGFQVGDRRTLQVEADPAPSGAQIARYHAYVGVGSSRLGSPTAGSGGFAPRLTTTELPVQGGATTLHVDDAVGGTIGVIGVSLAAPIAMPFGSGTLHLATLDLLVAVPASGSSGQPGAGSYSLPLTIPVNPALIGSGLVAQSLAFDTAGSGGFTLTNALEIWLR